MATQRSLFAEEDPLEEEYATARSLAVRLPRGLRLGTSSWSFPGWKGIVYRGDHSEAWLARHGLAQYAQHPLFGTVGIDRSYYAAVPDETWLRYASQLPDGFRCCIKAPATVTSAVVPGSDHGARAGAANPDFLSPTRFAAEMGERLNAHFAAHTGVVMLEVPRVSSAHTLSSEAFCKKLAAFLEAAPKGIRFAVELREASLFTPRYVRTLREYDASHVYNWWTAMPPLDVQARAVPPTSQPAAVVRVLLPPGARYEERKRALAPFDRIREEFWEMRDAVVTVVRDALVGGVDAWVLVSNKAEGCAPRTVRALAERLAEG